MWGRDRSEDDARKYLDRYPGQKDDPSLKKNLLFYKNQLKSQPNNLLVEEFHKHWWNNFTDLEVEHGFVQWFFPIREQGLNHQAHPLQLHEIAEIKADPACMARFLRTYELMLHFYGMKLVDKKTGEVDRDLDIWKAQYHNLETHPHNFLRITRILKCLGELDLDHYQFPFMKHIYDEIFLNNNLLACENSARTYWERVVRDDQKRAALKKYAASFRPIPTGFGRAARKAREWKELEGTGPAVDLKECKLGRGQPVQCQWKSKGKMYSAQVMMINKDGTYQVLYSDGDVDLFMKEGALKADASRDAQWEEWKKAEAKKKEKAESDAKKKAEEDAKAAADAAAKGEAAPAVVKPADPNAKISASMSVYDA